MRTRSKRIVRRPGVEVLETRAVPATFGVPWSDPGHLTLSFAPDGTTIAGHASLLFDTLGEFAATPSWQQQILRAFQTWAVQANVNIGVAADGGQAFGAAGPSQGDSRFGDIRIGAQVMAPDALSVSVPSDPAMSSTWTGDVLINTQDDFGPGELDLFAVMLHEAGHVFGIGESTDPSSPMFASYNGTQALRSGDVAALQGLYGQRAPDIHEGSSGNDSQSKATQLSGNSDDSIPIVAFGDVTTGKDVDFYAIKTPSNGGGPMTFRLQSAGLSLLAPKLTILDSRGNVLRSAQASSGFGDTVSIHLDRSTPGSTYFVKVEGATRDVFGIGRYAVAATFDDANKVSPDALEAALRGPFDTLSSSDLIGLFSNPSQTLFNADDRSNDDLLAATQLSPKLGYAKNSYYQAVGSLGPAGDVDAYRIQAADAPHGQDLVLTVSVRALAPNGVTPRVAIFDGDLHRIPAQILANEDGTFSVQATGLKASGNYYLQVESTGGEGNYALDAWFGTTATPLSSFAAGDLDGSAGSQTYNLYVGETQLMSLLLSADSVDAPAGTLVSMVIRDQAGNVFDSLTVAVGDTISGPAILLTPGAYTIEFSVIGSGPGTSKVSYSLLGISISDPIGPVLLDPTYAPLYQSPTSPTFFYYPTGTLTTSPYLIVLPPPNTVIA